MNQVEFIKAFTKLTPRQQEALLKVLVLCGEDRDTDAGLYDDHLRRHLLHLKQHPELAAAVKKVVNTLESVQLESMQGFKLNSTGLVNLQGHEVTPRCNLYRQYFGVWL